MIGHLNDSGCLATASVADAALHSAQHMPNRLNVKMTNGF